MCRLLVLHRRKAERIHIWLLILVIGHTGMSILSTAVGAEPQDVINATVAEQIRALQWRIDRIDKTLDYILLAIVGGFVAQLWSALSKTWGRSGPEGRRRRSEV